MNTFSLKRINPRVIVVALVVVLLFAQVAVSFAQTNTPVPPTATQVPLTIPTAVIFSETNNWMEVFAPIAAIGIGIGIALAVLGYLGKMIKGAFN